MSFKDDVNLATIGEYTVFCALLEFHGIKTGFDVRHDKRFQGWDVDFLILDKNLQVTWVEVKMDMKAYESGNFFYETESHGKIGCLEKTKADFIAFYVPQSGNIYMCDTQALRRCVSNHDYRLIDAGDESKGYLIPIGDLERYGVINRMIQTTPLPIERKRE